MKRAVRLACVTAALLLSSCAVVYTPYPAPKRVESRMPSGETFDLSFIRPGVTKQEEVETKLANLKLDAHTPGLFWGQFAVSRSGTFWMIGGAYAGGDAKASRHWSGRNLLVTFNDAGTVVTSQIIRDSELDSTLNEWFKNHPRPLRLPISLYVPQPEHDKVNREGHLILDDNEIRFEEISCNTCDQKLVFPLTDSVQVYRRSLPVKEDHDRFMRSIALTGGHKKVSFKLDSLSCNELLDLLAYLHKYCRSVEYR